MKGTILITGASRGIGRALVLEWAAKGHPTVAVARSMPELESLASEVREKHGVECTPVACDLTDEKAREALLRRMPDVLQGVVNNAGFGTAGRFDSIDRQSDMAMLRLNVEALTDLCHLFLPHLRAFGNGAFLVNVASTAAFQPIPLFSTYAATKAYVLSFSEALAEELAPEGIHVFAACPGVTESGFQAIANVIIPGGKAPSAAEVATWIVERTEAKKRVSVHGFKNAFLAFASRLGPRRLVLMSARKTVEPWFAVRE